MRWPAPLFLLALTACAPTQGIRALHFQADEQASLAPASLLSLQKVPPDRLLSVPEALRRAPDGSVLLVCQRRLSFIAFWGVCSHLSRKLSAGWVTDSPSIFAGGVQNRPESTLYGRDVVIVLDVGVTPEMLPRLAQEAQRLKGTPYVIAGTGRAGLDCTTYQNALQLALGLPLLAERNPGWRVWLPQDVLSGPALRQGGQVLWVGQSRN